jgi:hypothetical protein
MVSNTVDLFHEILVASQDSIEKLQGDLWRLRRASTFQDILDLELKELVKGLLHPRFPRDIHK